MKEINLRTQSLQPFPSHGENALNKQHNNYVINNGINSVINYIINYVINIRFSAAFACLLFTTPLYAQEWSFDDRTKAAYNLIFDLRMEEIHAMIPDAKTPQEHYVLTLAEAVELLLNEDPDKYDVYEERFKKRLNRKIKTNDPNDLFVTADMHLQWAFVYFKFGHEYDAGLNFREAYLIARDLKSKYPDYQAIRKTTGVLDVILGSVPENYEWILKLLNMEGSIPFGLHDIVTLRESNHPLAMEADLLYAAVQGFVLHENELASKELIHILETRPANKLLLFEAAALCVKNSQGYQAKKYLLQMQELPGVHLTFADYLLAQCYLENAEYKDAINTYRYFAGNYKGKHFIKDAYYKIGICYWLQGNKNDALYAFKQAKTSGKTVMEADKYAARHLEESDLPHPQLCRVRYFTDGGYYEEARMHLTLIDTATFTSPQDKVEYIYREARLSHKTNDLPEAKKMYLKCIDANGQSDYYYAPNACLQLGYIAMDENDQTTARTFFNRALSYKKHEYKNSIDSKAKMALNQLAGLR